VSRLLHHRVAARAASARGRAAFHQLVASHPAEGWMERVNVDDAIRVLGFQVGWLFWLVGVGWLGSVGVGWVGGDARGVCS
jgi:hypothetical protein